MDPSEVNEENTSFLRDPLSLPDLIKNGARFEINSDFDDFAAFEDDIIEDEDHDDEEWARECRNMVSPWLEAFDDLKEKMRKVNDDLHKTITRAGNAEKGVVPLNARVSVRYNAYWEGEGAPFDSSHLRGSTYQFYTGHNEVLPGLEQAVLTMHEGEESQFVISYKLLFGELGCPPRIKPKSDGLFVIEVVSFNLVGNAEADLELSPEERSKYKKVIEKVKDIHTKGLDFFGQKMYKNACLTFQKAANLLTFCNLENEEEENAQKSFLIKLHTNMAICYIKTNQPGKACIMVREIKQLTGNKPSCKALFQEGKALSMLGEYIQAKRILNQCIAMEPHNQEIINEISLLDKRFGEYKQKEKELWTKAIGVKTSTEHEEESDGTVNVEMQTLMEQFRENCSISELKLPNNMSYDEIEKIKKLAKTMELSLKIAPTGEDTFYSLVKKTLNK